MIFSLRLARKYEVQLVHLKDYGVQEIENVINSTIKYFIFTNFSTVHIHDDSYRRQLKLLQTSF
jgi:hypothetical protein